MIFKFKMFLTNKIRLIDLFTLSPLFLLPIFNMITSSFQITLEIIILALCVSITEELLFRGILIYLLRHKKGVTQIVVSSVLFSASHILNLFNGYEIEYVLLQVILSFFIGIAYASVTLMYRSLLPVIFAHFFTNISSSNVSISTNNEFFVFIFCSLLYAFYDYWLLKNIVVRRVVK